MHICNFNENRAKAKKSRRLKFGRNLLHSLLFFFQSKQQTLSHITRSLCVRFVYAFSIFFLLSALVARFWIEYFIRPITISFHLLWRVGICFIPVYEIKCISSMLAAPSFLWFILVFFQLRILLQTQKYGFVMGPIDCIDWLCAGRASSN